MILRQNGVSAETRTPVPRVRGPRDTIRACTAIAWRYMEARLSGDPLRIAAVEREFVAGTCDPAWATTISEYLKFFGPGGQRREIPYVQPSHAGERVLPLKSGSRIALIADWGTGTEAAFDVLTQISDLKPDVLIHLGDVYYSGTPEEYKHAFLDPVSTILRRAQPALPVFALSGNHDMYCGGTGYYQCISTLNSDPFKQKASFFCLRAEDGCCQLLAMDTGLNDYSPLDVSGVITHLHDEEFDWLLRRITEFSGSTILLSHHQMFSAFSRIGNVANGVATNPHLLQFFSEADRLGNISAWFWGHEHSLGIYEPYAGLSRGRCVGHGAVPVASTEKPYIAIADLKRPPKIKPNTELGVDGNVYAHGFVFFTLGNRDNATRVDYYQCRGGKADVIYSELLE